MVARPIEATEPVTGADAERLLRDLENVCSPDEARRRTQVAIDYLDRIKPKPERIRRAMALLWDEPEILRLLAQVVA